MKLSSAVLLLSSSVVASSPASQINNTGDANNDNASQKLRGSSGAPVADGFDDKFHNDFAKENLPWQWPLLHAFENQLVKSSCMSRANPKTNPNDKGVFLLDCPAIGNVDIMWQLDGYWRVYFGDDQCLGTDIDGGDLILVDCDVNDTSQRWTLQDDGRIRNQRYGQYIGVTGYGERLELQDEIKFVICGFTITQWPTALQQKWFW
mmetsp:Transcript_4188/g.6660  ORF Transcript_4188/g.6660 Transcript_4188/m.6660 type:complete len:206 (-) Transcript_4188:313-930(-)